MLKNVQFKIILLFSILGICLILGMGMLSIWNMKEVMLEVATLQDKLQVIEIGNQMRNTGIVTMIFVTL